MARYVVVVVPAGAEVKYRAEIVASALEPKKEMVDHLCQWMLLLFPRFLHLSMVRFGPTLSKLYQKEVADMADMVRRRDKEHWAGRAETAGKVGMTGDASAYLRRDAAVSCHQRSSSKEAS
jgi:hypothetical protein